MFLKRKDFKLHLHLKRCIFVSKNASIFFSKTWQIDIIFRVARRHTRRQYVKRILSCSSTDITRMFHSQAVTNLKTADAFSMATLCRMTKIQDTAPDNRSCATDHKHQTRNSATEHKQSSASCQLSRMAQKNNQAIEMHLKNYHFFLPSKFTRIRVSSSHVVWFIPPNVRAAFFRGKNVVVEVFQLVHLLQEQLLRQRFDLCFEQLSDQQRHLAAMLVKGRHLTQEQLGQSCHCYGRVLVVPTRDRKWKRSFHFCWDTSHERM